MGDDIGGKTVYRNLSTKDLDGELLTKSCAEESEKTDLHNFCAQKRAVMLGERKISYYSFGKGEDVVFLHGWGANAAAFLFVAKQLCAKYRVTMVDFAGFGASDRPPRAYGVDDYAREVLQFLDAIGINRATFVGHSFGGRVAIELAVFSGRVERLVLVDSAGVKPRRKPSYYVKVIVHKIARKLGLKGLKGSSDYRALDENMKKTFVKVVGYDQRPILKYVDCPTAIFWGDKDKETPLYMFRCLKKNIVGSQSFLLHGGHFAYIDDQYAFVAILKAFLDETKDV